MLEQLPGFFGERHKETLLLWNRRKNNIDFLSEPYLIKEKSKARKKDIKSLLSR